MKMKIIQGFENTFCGKILGISPGAIAGTAELNSIRSRLYSSLHMFKRSRRSQELWQMILRIIHVLSPVQ